MIEFQQFKCQKVNLELINFWIHHIEKEKAFTSR